MEDRLEMAQVLGFDSIEEMEAHAAWLLERGDPVHLNWLERQKLARGESADFYLPCIQELDQVTGLATGSVEPFCSVQCRGEGLENPGFKLLALGVQKLSDFGYTPHCEACGKPLHVELLHA